NRIAFEWFGYTEDEFRQGLNVLQMLAPEDRELAGAAFRAILEGKVKLGLPGEYRAQKKDGSTFPITIYYSPVIVQGRITGLRGIIIDITERKRVEKELRTISAYNRSLLEASLDLFVTINSEGKVADVNTSTELATGYSREELIGTDFSDYFTEPEQAKAGYQRVFTQGTVRDYPLSIRNSDGHITPVLCNATVYRDETGNVSGVFAAVHDITERKRAEVALVENEERLRTILHSMQTGIIVIDAHTHTILDANQKSLDMIGGTKEAVLGSVCHSYICPAELGKCPMTDLAQVIDSSERILISTKGKKIPIIKSVIPTILGGKKVLIESVIDITERKRAEDTIALTARKLTLMNDVTYQYIQNKITGLRGYADLSKDAKTEAERLSFIEKEEHVLADIHHLIRDTQEYQEIGSLLPRWIPVEQSIRIAVSRVSPKEDISIKSALSGLELYSDPLIEKIFANLIENAVLHGKTTRRITFSCEKTPGGLILICEDDGVGISSKDKVRLFDRSVGEKIHFGLFFVQECLLLSGMTIVETGKPGKGARFEITVPKGKWRMKDVNQ
ncbi:MAG: PAS domain S-box protein, partial [Methanoregula sp.]|nr:PAS domain S-box protein [Methanoregula sp.]